jgi:hypothetical protein
MVIISYLRAGNRSMEATRSEDNSFTMASGEVLVPRAFSAVLTESNQRFGILSAAWGSATTRLLQRMNSPTVPTL